ncbi:MAG: hypothetical protein HW402_87 [Dehalococcoidales bacterium]|nr:hypothetical protein [Dehalococcoidales bacterium]
MPSLLLVTRLIIILGVINLVTGLMIFLSCRCLAGAKIGKWLMKYQTYRSFYKYHCLLWKIFWPSVMIHAIMVMIFLGWPN